MNYEHVHNPMANVQVHSDYFSFAAACSFLLKKNSHSKRFTRLLEFIKLYIIKTKPIINFLFSLFTNSIHWIRNDKHRSVYVYNEVHAFVFN